MTNAVKRATQNSSIRETKTNSVTLVCKRTIPTERPPIVYVVPTFADRGRRVVSAMDSRSSSLSILCNIVSIFLHIYVTTHNKRGLVLKTTKKKCIPYQTSKWDVWQNYDEGEELNSSLCLGASILCIAQRTAPIDRPTAVFTGWCERQNCWFWILQQGLCKEVNWS
jgi:hypothetical protein